MDEQARGEDTTTALVPIEVRPVAAALPSRSEISIIGLLAKSVIAAKGHAVPQAIDSPAKAFAVMLAGWEVGAKPMTALRHMFVINGRTEPDAQLMMGIVKARDPSARFQFHTRNAEVCDVELFRGGKSVVRIAYSAADADRAGLLKKGGPWTQYRPDMMAWAAVKRACRLGAPDLVNAISGVDVGEAGDMMNGLEEEVEAVTQEVQALPPEALVNEGDEAFESGAASDPAASYADEPAEEADPSPAPEKPAPQAKVKNLADLWNRGLKAGYPNKVTMLSALGYTDDTQVVDLEDCWQRLQNIAASRKAERLA